MVWSEHQLHFSMILSVLPCMCQFSKTEAVQGLIPQPLSPELSPPTSLLPTFKLYSNCIHLGHVLTKSITVARGHGIPLKGLSQPRPTFEAESRGVGSVPFKMLGCFIMEEWWDMQGKKSEMSTLWLKKKITLGRDFSGGSVIKNLPSNAGDEGSIPGRGTEIPHTTVKLSQHTITTGPTCSRARVPQERPTYCNKDPVQPNFLFLNYLG